MNVKRFDVDAAPRPADREPPRPTEGAPAPMRAASPGDPEDQRSEEQAEEPGYGHGV